MDNSGTYLSKRLVLLTIAPFPHGNVSTLRISSYLKALNNVGVDSLLLIYAPTSMAIGQMERYGCIDGIRFQYAGMPYWGNVCKLFRPYLLFKSLLSSANYLIKNKPETIILYGDNPFLITWYFRILSSSLKARFIGDRSELPTIDERNSKFRLWMYNTKQRWFDGMIIMTKQLCKYYESISKKSNFVFFMPMTIDTDRFKGVVPNKKPYIATVFGTHNRDGLADSIKAYISYVKHLNGSFDLLLIGNYEKMPNRTELDEIIQNSGISDRIKVYGLAALNDIPQLLADASCLLTTPTEYISGGFPTKMGEYMLSGSPIVATIAGELLDYIEPGKDMLMCYPTEMEKVSDLLLYIEQNPKKAFELSANAQIKASLFFDANTYVNELVNFIFTATE